ncbi:MAG: DUF3343 domain-containing protein [Ruminococcus sp.]|nr:DUF3343 domain-containing protein [Ruminococcus sp.]
MNHNLILFHSMTSVLKGREVLRRRGIASRVIRTPSQLRRGSCGYSLLINRRFDEALRLIEQENIPTAGVAAVDIS